MKLKALILAGGRATRMGGRDKGLLLFRGEALALNACERLAGQADEIEVSANRSFSEYRSVMPAGTRIVRDRRESFPGALAGIEASLELVPREEAGDTWLLSVPCDSPFFPLDLAEKLLSGARLAGARGAFVISGGFPEPGFSLLRADVLPELSAYLDQGGHRIREFLGKAGAVKVEFPDPKAFRNCNTPEELKEAEESAA